MDNHNMRRKFLLVLDFDHTIINVNGDTYIAKVAPDGVIPENLYEVYKKDGWTKYMDEVFAYLHNNGVNSTELLNCAAEMPLTPGMKELLQFAGGASDFMESIIISDANSLFIDRVLAQNGLRNSITQIFTNPARIDDNGRLRIQGYHFQNWCSLSSENLCKGYVLEQFLETKKDTNYAAVFYVGDGRNDLCPSLKLKEQDSVFARKGFPLASILQKLVASKDPKMSANLYIWESAHDILAKIKSIVE